MACTRSCNLSSNLEELNIAKKEIEQAWILKDSETMFQNERHV